MVSSSSGISDNIDLPEDTRMRIKVRRAAAFALVGLTLNTIAYTLTGPVIALLEADAGEVYQSLGLVLFAITAPLVVIGGHWLRAYPLNRHMQILSIAPAVAALFTLLQRFVVGFSGSNLAIGAWFVAQVGIFIAADRILKDGAGDPTAPRSRIAVVTLGVVGLRTALFLGQWFIGLSYIPIVITNLVIATLTIVTFTRIRKLLL
jgi:hypothetical protein